MEAIEMWKHTIDPLITAQIEQIRSDFQKARVHEHPELDAKIAGLEAQIHGLNEILSLIEEKQDEILKRLDSPERSIPGDGKDAKQPPLDIAPGHKPWSQRKFEREQSKRDPGFAAKILKGSAATEPVEE